MADLDKEFKEEVKKQAKEQAAKWVLLAFVGMAVIAASGWWFYFEPKIQGYILQVAGEVPNDAIVAFDRTPSNPCPEGWTVWREATSRVILGAGNNEDSYEEKYQLDENGKKLTPRGYREHGGSEVHILTIEEMPNHDHGKIFGGDGQTKAGMNNEHAFHASGYKGMKAEGGSKPHNNMPPFVALYYCKKQS